MLYAVDKRKDWISNVPNTMKKITTPIGIGYVIVPIVKKDSWFSANTVRATNKK